MIKILNSCKNITSQCLDFSALKNKCFFLKDDFILFSFPSGKSAVLKCLLDIHRVFQESDPAYILNDLYISDYCVWIQRAKYVLSCL